MMFRAARWKTTDGSATSSRTSVLVDDRARRRTGRRRDDLGRPVNRSSRTVTLRAGVGEPADERAADEPGAAGHEDAPAARSAALRSVICVVIA